jgi:hypothetical protein
MTDGNNHRTGDHLNGAALTYGEVTTPLRLFNALRLSREDVFLDIGSGRGQLVFGAAMCEAPPSLACGIEVVSLRHDAASAAWDAALSELKGRVKFIQGDALENSGAASDALRSATKLFINNTTFSPELNMRFANAMHPSCAKSLVRVATIASFERASLEKAELALVAVTTVEGGWCPAGTMLHVYGRVGSEDSTAPNVDSAALQQMLERRTEDARQAEARAELSNAELERGLMRNVLMAAAVADASRSGAGVGADAGKRAAP